MKSLLIILFTFAAIHLHAQTLEMNDETSTVKLETRHLLGLLTGTYKGVKGTGIFNPSRLSSSFIKFKFDAATVVLNDNDYGPNLTREDCFFPAKYQYIELSSISISKLKGANRYQFKGMLKIKGISKPISFPITAAANVGGYDFAFAFNVNRKDYNLDCGLTSKHLRFNISTYAKRTMP